MEKWERELKEQVNKTPSSIVKGRMEQTLKTLPSKRKVSKLYSIVAAVIFFITILVSGSYLSPALAESLKSLPIVGTVFETVGNIGIQKGNQEGLTMGIGQQVEIDGYLVTFTESLYDGSEIHIGYVIESQTGEPVPYDIHLFDNVDFTINGRTKGNYGWGGQGKEIENGAFAGTISLRFGDSVPDEFVLGIAPYDGSSDWKVDIPIQLQGENKSFLVRETKVGDDYTIHYDSVTFFPTTTEISFRLVRDSSLFHEEEQDRFLDYQVVDDQGRVLQPFSGNGYGKETDGMIVETILNNYEPLTGIPKSLTIKPYYVEWKDQGLDTIKQKWDGSEIVLHQGDIGHLNILEVEEVDQLLTVTLHAEGKNAYDQSVTFWLEDKKGTQYFSEYMPPKRVDDKMNHYKISFSEFPDMDDLYVVTRELETPNFIKELETTIHFDK
ncbi:DUF4179 domain-containing protein [Evansella tamaricis]|uniref:DUF4179 domain-containing protein n=1 Tax=Evansella tamaricis TaxID=2069301 RepID=A0ABS6JGD5_9BACI|nr:DUF4179 domain-containing protein [Evansella tamaricis]MBU9712593.1 DUF4179 domain-containing protein [Evansella tamaricis]